MDKNTQYHCMECHGIMDQFISRPTFEGYRCKDCKHEEYIDKKGDLTKSQELSRLLDDDQDLYRLNKK